MPEKKIRSNNTQGPSRTKQSQTVECDVNRIVNRYLKTGVIPPGQKTGIYADVSALPDFQESLDYVRQAQDDFNRLDVNIRNKFHNNPEELINFLSNPENNAEAVKLGLKDKSILPDVKDPVEPPTPPPAGENPA